MSVMSNQIDKDNAQANAAEISGSTKVGRISSSANNRNWANTGAALNLGAGGIPGLDQGGGSLSALNPLSGLFGGNSKKRRAAIETKKQEAANSYMSNWAESDQAGLNPFQESISQYAWAGKLPGSYTSPDDPGAIYLNPAGATADPRGTQAQITRAQYDDWSQTFQPAEGDLLSMTTYDGNPGLAAGLIADQNDNIEANFANAAGAEGRTRARYGMQATAEEQAAAGKSSAMEQSLAKVDSANKVNQWQKDLNREIMSSGVTSSMAARKGA